MASPSEPAHVEKVRLTRRAGRKARYEQVMEGRSQGLTAKEIARQLNMSERTVQTWLAVGTFPEAKKRRKKPSSFDTFAPYVLKRWQEGERNGLVLWREIQKQGYTGSERTVYRHIETLKQASVQASLNLNRLHTFTASTAVWLFVRDPKSLDEVEQEDLATFCQASLTLKRTYDLVQDAHADGPQERGISARRLVSACCRQRVLPSFSHLQLGWRRTKRR